MSFESKVLAILIVRHFVLKSNNPHSSLEAMFINKQSFTPPGADAFSDTFVFTVEVPAAPSRARRPCVAVMPAHALRDITQEGLAVGLQGHVSMGLDHCIVVIWAYPPTNRGLNPNARHTRTRSTATRILSQAIPSVPPEWARPISPRER